MKLLWLIVNCNSVTEAKKIGEAALKNRLTVCYDVFPRLFTKYFWPPKTSKTTSGKGAVLIITTLPKHLKKLQKLVQSKHPDRVPFMGTVEIKNVNPEYYKWMMDQLKR